MDWKMPKFKHQFFDGREVEFERDDELSALRKGLRQLRHEREQMRIAEFAGEAEIGMAVADARRALEEQRFEEKLRRWMVEPEKVGRLMSEMAWVA
jgi:hypothetical protein